MISGALKFFCNFIFLFNTGSFSKMAWYDRHGNYRQIQMGEGYLSIMTILQMISCGVLIYKQGKLTKMIFAPILKEYRDAETGQTNGIQMTYRKAPKMQWLKKMVKKFTLWMIVLNGVTMIVGRSFANDIAHQAITQEYELMEKKNSSFVDFGFDPEQFWINPKHDQGRPQFRAFEFDDGNLDFDFNFGNDDDVFKALDENDIFKMLGNENETNSIISPYFNNTEIEPFFNETAVNTTEPMPLIGGGNHDK